MTARTPRHGPQAGFTLVELLVSLGILGLVAGLLLASIGTVAVLAGRARDGTADADQVIAAQAVVRARIERLRPVLRRDSAVAIVDAQGDDRAFAFVAPPLDRDAPDALRRYRLMLDGAGNLTLYSAGILDPRVDVGDPALVGWTPMVLLRGATKLMISYHGVDARGRRGWQARWAPHPQPPDLVAITVGFAPGDRRRWPRLVVRLPATANAACRIDAITGRCKDQA